MSRTVTALTGDMLARLPESVQTCAYWELDPVTRAAEPRTEQLGYAKSAWLSSTLLEWGCCGQVAVVDGRPAGFLTYAPPALVPSSDGFATSPPAEDAVLLMTGQVFAPDLNSGVGRLLMQAMVKDLIRREIRAVEAFASTGRRPTHGGPSDPCLLPSGFLARVGFRTVRPHPTVPRLRLEVRNAVTWRQEVESAIDRLLGSVTAPGRTGELTRSADL